MILLAEVSEGGFGAFAPWINAGAAMCVCGVGAWWITKLPSLKAEEHRREMERQAARDTHDRELRQWHSESIAEQNRQNEETRGSVKELAKTVSDLCRDVVTIPCRYMSREANSSHQQHSQPG